MYLSHTLPLSILIIGTWANPLEQHRHINRETSQPFVRLSSRSNVTFRGSTKEGVESFLNIKFGSDPSGQNRFAPPKPYTYQADEVYDASHPGTACPQMKVPIPDVPMFDNVTNVSEDCLTLRVDRPAGTTQEDRLPVMVYIYGGGDTFGQIYDGAYDHESLVSSAAMKGLPVIYAAMNYRLGIFGFAAMRALRTADSLNVGLLDQRIALEWIQENIAAFGGDPSRVTIFGESDGATGVGLQITAYGGDVQSVPFKRAIMQSGAPTADIGTASDVSAVHTAAVVNRTNCSAATNEEELSCLRGLPLSTLLNVTINYELSVAQWGLDVFIPTAPSSFIPDSPSRLLYSVRFAHDIDIITGWNENDGSLFTPPTIRSNSDVADFLASSMPGLTNKSVDEALQLYPVSEFKTDPSENISAQYFRASRMYRDAQYSCPSLLLARAMANFSSCDTSNYLFALNQTVFSSVYEAAGVGYYGVSHFSDIPFVFNQAETRYAAISSKSDKKVSSLMSGSWAAFADSGRVCGRNGTLPDWPEKEDDDAFDVRIIGGSNPRLESFGNYESLRRRCDFWNSPLVTGQMGV